MPPGGKLEPIGACSSKNRLKKMRFFCHIAILFTGILLCDAAVAQNTPDNPDFVKAYNFISKDNVDSALIFIDKAVADSAVRKNALAWYVRGFIYKEAFKKCKRLVKPTVGMSADMCRDLWSEPEQTVNNYHGNAAEQKWIYGQGSYLLLKDNVLVEYQAGENTAHYNVQHPYSYSDTALASLFRSLALDSSAENRKNCTPTINYIAAKYYSHASILMDSVHYPSAITFFNKYEAVMKKLNPSGSTDNYKVSFQMALGDVYSQLFFHSGNESTRKIYFDSAKRAYNTVLSLNPDNVGANYSLAILYYNQAVYIINNLSYDVADLKNLNNAQDTEVVLMKKSLPYMEKTYQLDPRKRDAIEGLKGIYYLLHEYQKASEYDEKLKALNENKQ